MTTMDYIIVHKKSDGRVLGLHSNTLTEDVWTINLNEAKGYSTEDLATTNMQYLLHAQLIAPGSFYQVIKRECTLG